MSQLKSIKPTLQHFGLLNPMLFHFLHITAQKIYQNMSHLFFLRIYLVPNNSSESIAVMQRGFFSSKYVGLSSPGHSPISGRVHGNVDIALSGTTVKSLPCSLELQSTLKEH